MAEHKASKHRQPTGKGAEGKAKSFDQVVAQEFERRQAVLSEALNVMAPLVDALRMLKGSGMPVSMRLDPPATLDEVNVTGEMTVPRFHPDDSGELGFVTYSLCFDQNRDVLSIQYPARNWAAARSEPYYEHYPDYDAEILTLDPGRLSQLTQQVLDAAIRLRLLEENREMPSFSL